MTRCRRLLLAAFALATLLCSGSSLGACSAPLINQAPDADVVITQQQFGTTVTVAVGQTISIPWQNTDRWHVSFASPPLQLLNETQKPPSGWRFRVISAGETDIVITLITTGDAAPSQFVVTIRAARSA